MKNPLLEQKLLYQSVKNCVNHLKGIEVVQICEDTDQDLLRLKNFHFPSDKEADLKINHHVSVAELKHWIQKVMGLKAGKVYYFLCQSLWVKIKISEPDAAAESLWHFSKWFRPERLQSYHTLGFLLADIEQTEILQVGYDSRDEYHYLFDRYFLSND